MEKIIIHDEVFYYDPETNHIDLAIKKLKTSNDYNKAALEELKLIAYNDKSRHSAPFMAYDHHFRIKYRDGIYVIDNDKY